MPTPTGLTSDEFYGHLDEHSDQIDQAKWDGAAFGARLEERVIVPGLHAYELLTTWPYLTRLFTTISPAEMTADPEFHARHDLPPVVNTRQGNRRILCSSQSGIRLPDERDVALTEDSAWPPWTDEMPWAESIAQVPLAGDPVQLRVNTPKIDELLAAWNASRRWPPPAVGQPADPGSAGGAGGASGQPTRPEQISGGCSAGGQGGAGGWLVLAAAAVAGRRRRA